VDLVFEIREGRVTEIERLTFVGNRNFSERRLRTALQTKQAGLLRALIGRDTFVADRIEFDKQVLRDFYLSRGYIDFDVLSVTSEFSQERNAFFLTFNIREGLSYDFGRITTTTELAEVNAAEFDALLKLRPGMTYSPALVEDAVARMEGLATKKGLNFIRVDPKITRDDANQRLDIEFQIVRGPRIFVERIDIEGNTTTIDRVVRREFKTVEGDPFNPREIRAAAERIRALGFFSTADVNAREGSSPDRVILDVNLDEQPTGSLSFGASYSTDSGVGLALGFTERNLMGRGQYLRFSIDSGTSESNSEITFIEPHFLDRDLALGLSLYYNTTDSDDSAEYDTKIIGFRPSIEFPLSDNGRLALRYTVQQDEISNVSTTNSSRILQLDEAGSPRLTSSVGYSYTYDSSRTGLDPRSRLMFRFSQDFAGLGGDANYLRTTALLSAERKTLNEDITFRAEFEAGALHMISGQSFLSDRFFLSSRQMRGFEGQGIGPRDNAAPNRDALGGNYYAVSRFEAEFPIGLPEEYGITGGLFYDVGTLWGLDNRNGGVGGLNRVDDNAYLRSAIGFSIYWNTQIGPLRFNFSKAIDKQPYDKERNFDLTIQTRF
jgi:outer membrane protein insertion porin family